MKGATKMETSAKPQAAAPGRIGAYGPPPLSAQEREELILEHLPQVRLIARRIHERLPESVHLEDLISTGIVGLIAAIDRFDPSQNVKLKTYAEYKIRGAILDSLRGLDWAPRQQRKRAKQIEAAIAAAEQKLHRAPPGNWARQSRNITPGWSIRAALRWAAWKRREATKRAATY
jgi:RNA polymerase sigma factor for flagellar operon FliA